jgi:hypothetical protein
LGNDPISVTLGFIHLVLSWSAETCTTDILEKIQLARRTVYALMGAGLHVKNGASPAASVKVVEAYVLPRLIYGLEATVLRPRELGPLCSYYKDLLCQIQGLPGRVATEAIFLLSGCLPLEAILHERMLGLYGSICRLQDGHSLRDLAIRQLTNGPHSNSWFVQLREIAQIYGLDLIGSHTSPWRKVTVGWTTLLSDPGLAMLCGRLVLSVSDKSQRL